MKKILSLFMAVILALSVLSGCGCAKQKKPEQADSNAQMPVAETTVGEELPEDENAPLATQTESSVELPAVSENKEVVTADTAPKVVMIQNPKNNVDTLTYHLENCKKLKGEEKQEVPWEMVQAIGFWQCPECNPPRYEDYKNAQ